MSLAPEGGREASAAAAPGSGVRILGQRNRARSKTRGRKEGRVGEAGRAQARRAAAAQSRRSHGGRTAASGEVNNVARLHKGRGRDASLAAANHEQRVDAAQVSKRGVRDAGLAATALTPARCTTLAPPLHGGEGEEEAGEDDADEHDDKLDDEAEK